MTQRISIAEAAPGALRAVLELERHVSTSVDHTVLELVKLRASVINGCAYCVDMHSRDALAAGERSERLFAVAAWHDAGCFTDRERAALALTDAVTRIADGGVSDEVWADAGRYWSEAELGELIVAIGTINLWNRIAITSRTVPASHRSARVAG